MSARLHSITATLALALALGSGPAADAAPRAARPSQRPAVEVIQERHGFDWSDAAVGAVGGLGVSMLALGGVLLIGARHRQQRSAVTTTRRYR
jgi:hypothetical protein